MINLVNQSWEEDVLINDAFGEEFSLNNLLTFQATSSPPTVEIKTQLLILITNLNQLISVTLEIKGGYE